MAKDVPSPYTSTAPARVRAVGDQPQHTLYSLEDELVLIPISFVVSAGALQSQQVTGRCFVEEQSSGVFRIYHPFVQDDGAYVFLGQTVTSIDRSTASEGYVTVTTGAVTATFEGYLGLVGTLADRDHRSNNAGAPLTDFQRARTLAEREQERVSSPVPRLTVGAIGFKVDGSGDYLADSGRGVPLFSVTHGGAGDYTITTSTEFNAGFEFTVLAQGVEGSAAVGSSNNEISLTLTADPGANDDVSILYLGPTSLTGTKFCQQVNTVAPSAFHCRNGVYPAAGMLRDLSFIPFQFAVDGSGNILREDANTSLPPNLSVTKDGSDYKVNMGMALDRRTVAGARFDSGTGAMVVDYNTVETDGNVIFSGSPTSTVVRGWIASCWNSEV